MSEGRPANWRQWIKTEERRSRLNAERARGAWWRRVLRCLQVAFMLGVVLFAAYLFLGAEEWWLNQVGDYDSWAFWLEEKPVATLSGLGHGGEPTITLALINRPKAAGAALLVDGKVWSSFDSWKVKVRVRAGQTLAVRLEEGAAPIRLRVIATHGVRTPGLGREWALVGGRKILGAVTLESLLP